MSLAGTYTALITPFKAGSGDVDWDGLEKLVGLQLDGGVEGIVPCGTTGESPALSHEEHRKVIARVIEATKSRNKDAKVIAGTGSNSTHEAIQLTRDAGADGADYALSVNPYYNKPTQQGLLEHFTAIAEESSIPLILYNIPGRTAVKLELDTICKLAEHKNIAGIKEATGDLNLMTQIILNTADDFVLLSGDDNILLPILSVGGKGVISVISNIFPRQASEITRLYLAGKIDEAKAGFFKLFPLCQLMFLETNPIPVKFAAAHLGLCADELRLPMTSLAKGNQAALKTAVDGFVKK